MNNRTATVKVGLLTIISLMVLVTTVIWLRGRTLGGGQPYEVYFKDVDGLRDGAAVQFMGIRVGFVDEVTPMSKGEHRYRVRVRFTITEPDVKVPPGSSISLEQSGIIGEKFMELTPPRPKTYNLTLKHREPSIRPNMPIMVAFKQGFVEVGKVQNVLEDEIPKILRKTPDYRYELKYLIDKPGYLPPGEVHFEMFKDDEGHSFLVLVDPQALWANAPSADQYFTLEEPLRLKEFLEEQLASAEALKSTNEKINQLLSDETIDSIQGTLKNSEKLTAQATVVLSQANTLISSTSKDLRVLVNSAEKLTDSVIAVSGNINEIAGNPEMKANIHKTVQSVQESTAALSTLLNDPNLKVILSDAKVTSQNAAELMTYLKKAAIDNDLEGQLSESLTLLNSSLTRLAVIMESLDSATGNAGAIKEIIEDTKETSDNINKFSEKLNKRFLLFRLLF